MFDIWIKFENINDACKFMNWIIIIDNSQNQCDIFKNKDTLNYENQNDEQATLVNSISDSDENDESDVDNDDNNTDNDNINDSDIDDDIDAGFNGTKVFFWRRFFFVVHNHNFENPNFFLVKMTIVYTKKKDHRFWK